MSERKKELKRPNIETDRANLGRFLKFNVVSNGFLGYLNRRLKPFSEVSREIFI